MKDPIFPGETVEAAGHWVSVKVCLTNTSKERQSAKELLMPAGNKLIGAKGKAYEMDAEATGAFYERLEKTPFNPGESRSFTLFFDAPTKETFKHVELLSVKSTEDIRLSVP